jgi:hypothetical protein
MSQKPPKIEFPCQYPIKVIGKADENFDAKVIEIINPFLEKPFEGSVETRDSEKGNYTAVTVEITATGEEQLKAIFEALNKNEKVIMVL